MCTIHGLPPETTLSDLLSPDVSSSGLIEAKIEDYHPQAIPGHKSAILKFSARSGAEKAKESLESMLLWVELSAGSNQDDIAEHSVTKRHKFTPEDKLFLEEQFGWNPRPSAEERRILAARLCVDEKRIQTWFNNRRQRQKIASNTSMCFLTVYLLQY